ncbi:MAG TPA: 50S ribosomal protein L18a [Candidatus Woesearchaeota archaeon]|nr:50S ribosomal protein L18a [Candidatus Woesearchaeota archaeon]
MKFLVKGEMRFRGEIRKFSKEIEAQKEYSAREKIKSLFGSKNKIKRNLIKIDSVEKLSE